MRRVWFMSEKLARPLTRADRRAGFLPLSLICGKRRRWWWWCLSLVLLSGHDIGVRCSEQALDLSVLCVCLCVCACANICLVIDSPIEISPLICIEMECNQCNRCSVQFVLFLFLSLVAAITLSAEWVPIARLVAPFVSFCWPHYHHTSMASLCSAFGPALEDCENESE